MAINTIQGFNPSTTEPIDSRVTVANETARLAFATFNVYEGLVVYQEDTDELYVLNDAANPNQTSSWSTVGEGTGFPFTGSAQITGSLGVTGSGDFSKDITVNGLTVGRGLADDISNTVLGADAFSQNTGGTNNVAIGIRAYKSGSGEGNTAVGYEALRDAQGASETTAIGRAVFRKTSGDGNVGIGAYVGVNNTTGFLNVGIGRFAFVDNTEGYYNVAIGNRSLRRNTTAVSYTHLTLPTKRIV